MLCVSATAVTQHPFRDNGQKIRRARQLITSPRLAANHRPDRPISGQDFAPLVGCSTRHLVRLENGEHLPSGALRDRIVEVTGTTEQIESSDDEEEAALPRDLIEQIAARFPASDLSWQALYLNPNHGTVERLRRGAIQDLSRSFEIEDSLTTREVTA